MHSASGPAGIPVIRTAPGEVAYTGFSMRNKHYPNGIMLDSGAAMSVCPVDYFQECGIQPSKRIELQATDGSSVEHYGSKDVFYVVGNEAMKVRFEVTSVQAPVLSLAALEDAGWRLGHHNDCLVLRRGDLSLQVDRVDNVYWFFGLEVLGRVKSALVADRVCGLEEIELERQQVRRPELLPQEHHIHPRSKPLPKEPSIEERRAHELTHEKELICALHAIDTEFLARTVIRADKRPIDFVIQGILEFLGEIGRKRIVIRSDNEPAVKALVQAVALHREDETVIEEIPVKSSQTIGCNEHDQFLVGCMVRALRIDMEKRFGDNFSCAACCVLVNTQAQWLASQPFLCRQGRLHSIPEVQEQNLQWRGVRSLSMFCSRFRLRGRESWMIRSVLVSGLGKPRGVMIT